MKCYFLRRIDGLDDDVIATNICDYLGDDARISRGSSTVSCSGAFRMRIIAHYFTESTDWTDRARPHYQSIPKPYDGNITLPLS
jgi:hypothetical protein